MSGSMAPLRAHSSGSHAFANNASYMTSGAAVQTLASPNVSTASPVTAPASREPLLLCHAPRAELPGRGQGEQGDGKRPHLPPDPERGHQGQAGDPGCDVERDADQTIRCERGPRSDAADGEDEPEDKPAREAGGEHLIGIQQAPEVRDLDDDERDGHDGAADGQPGLWRQTD